MSGSPSCAPLKSRAIFTKRWISANLLTWLASHAAMMAGGAALLSSSARRRLGRHDRDPCHINAEPRGHLHRLWRCRPTRFYRVNIDLKSGCKCDAPDDSRVTVLRAVYEANVEPLPASDHFFR